jgi:hypothetical protein
LIGIAIGLLLTVSVSLLFTGHLRYMDMETSLLNIVMCVVPILACWRISKRLDPKRASIRTTT